MNSKEIKQSIDLAEYIRSKGIELQKHGRDLIGICPFHQDSNPSLIVTPSKQLWHCMGCDKGGSIIDFVMEQDGLSLHEALEQLKSGCRTAYNDTSSLPPSESLTSNDSRLTAERSAQLLERVITLYEKNFSECEAAQAYLTSRGITDAALFSQHRIGFCNGSLPEILPKDGPIHGELKSLGILLEHGKERFKDCVIFPVFDASGTIVTLYGRHTGNGPKRHVYLPDRPTGFWNITAAKSFHKIILVESIIDALSVMMAGYQNVISIQGTNGLKEDDINHLKSLGVQQFVLVLDGDASGQKAASQLKGAMPHGHSEILTLPSDLDPNSFLLAEGPQALANLLSIGPSTSAGICREAASQRTNCVGSGDPTGSPAGLGRAQEAHSLQVTCGLRVYHLFGLDKGARKLRVTVRLEHAGKLHVDTLDLYNARGRQLLCRDLCRVFEQDPATIESDLNSLLVACENADTSTVKLDDAQPATIELTPQERDEAEAFGKTEDLINHILKDFEVCGLIGEETNKLLGYIAMTSRKMTDPLSVLILSSSGAGKTALQDAVLRFCPPEDLVKLTNLSGKALFYKERMSLKHKVLALEEGAGAEEATYAIRNLISADSLTTEVTVRDPINGSMTTMSNTVEGPTSVFVTTTNPQVDPETKSRFLVTGIDESREQTRSILEFQRKRHGIAGLDDDLEADRVIDRHRNFQRLLEPVAVVNNHAMDLLFDDDRLQSRRLQPQYLGLINTVAFLRQMTKPVSRHNGASYIEVDAEDVRIGNEIAIEILGRTLDELTIPARNLLDLLVELVDQEVDTRETTETQPINKSEILFTRRQIREFTGWTNTRLHTHLKELIEHEYVLLESGRGTSLQQYRLFYDGQGRDGEKFIIGFEG